MIKKLMKWNCGDIWIVFFCSGLVFIDFWRSPFPIGLNSKWSASNGLVSDFLNRSWASKSDYFSLVFATSAVFSADILRAKIDQ